MHKDGIYFNMSENEYFSDAERLDFSGMKKYLKARLNIGSIPA